MNLPETSTSLAVRNIMILKLSNVEISRKKGK